jgi:D-galacturonate reductase
MSSNTTTTTNERGRTVNALMVGAGEYTTGSVFTANGAAPDKPAGVCAITFTDLRRRGKINEIYLADAVGTRMPQVRDTMRTKIAEKYKDMEYVQKIETFPNDDVEFDAEAYKLAIAKMTAGDVVTIFTPDDTQSYTFSSRNQQ